MTDQIATNIAHHARLFTGQSPYDAPNVALPAEHCEGAALELDSFSLAINGRDVGPFKVDLQLTYQCRGCDQRVERVLRTHLPEVNGNQDIASRTWSRPAGTELLHWRATAVTEGQA